MIQSHIPGPPQNVSTNPIFVNRPVDGYPSFWAASEWQELQAQCGMNLVRFDQGRLGYARRKPTGLGTNMCPDESLEGLESPGCEVSHHNHSLGVSSQWAKWAPSLIEALSAMTRRRFKCVHGAVRLLASVSADFIRHVQRGNMPFRRD